MVKTPELTRKPDLEFQKTKRLCFRNLKKKARCLLQAAGFSSNSCSLLPSEQFGPTTLRRSHTTTNIETGSEAHRFTVLPKILFVTGFRNEVSFQNFTDVRIKTFLIQINIFISEGFIFDN